MQTSRSLWLILAILTLLPLGVFAQVALTNQAFQVARSDARGIDIQFTLPEWSMETVERDGQTLQRVNVGDAHYLYIDEQETLPVFATMIAIPYRGNATLNLLGAASQNSGRLELDFADALAAERKAGKYPEPLYPAAHAMISEPQVIRDFRVVTLNIHPFQYDARTGELLVRQNIGIRLDFDNELSVNEIEAPTSYSSAFESIYKGLILNYEQALNRDISYASPRMLVIYGNYSDTTYLAKVNEYVTWKRQKGYLVTAVSTATTGTTNTAIKSYIQNLYNNVATRPDYIVLIGDESGTIMVPSYSGYIDYYYTWLAGGDNLGDAVIGRISVTSSVELVNYVGKVMAVERDIDPDTASWLNKMLLVGDSASSGISTVYTNRYIKDTSYAINPDYTYTELYGSSPSSATMNSTMTQGVAYFNYRGYLGMSGWPSTMGNMNNGTKLFHAVIITCATGTFNGGTSTTESLVRLGTEAQQKGALTAIGMATTSTHTPMNNCLNVGIFHGVYPLEMREMGSAMLYGKLYLNAVYGISRPQQAYDFAGFCNLIGDPTAAVYVGVPGTFNVTAPSIIPAGSGNIEVTVKDGNNAPVAGASVSLVNPAGQQAVGFTGTDGKVLLDFATNLTGSLTLTVNKNDFKPAMVDVEISTGGGMVYDGATIDDDSTLPSSGNGNGEANSGETIELYVTLKNTSSTTLTPSGNITCGDPYVTPISFTRIEYNAIAPNQSADNIDPIVFAIAPNCPDQRRIILNFNVETMGGNYLVNIPVDVSNGKLNVASHTYTGAPGNNIYPGDTYPLTISLTNIGSAGLTGINGILRTNDYYFSVTDSLGTYGSIAQGATVANTTNTFTVNARGTCIEGMVIPLELYLYNSSGFQQLLPLSLTIGQVTVNDPLGQDAYGYFIFGQEDTGYQQCPEYQWIGIAPAEGGSGTALPLSDPGVTYDEGDQVGAVSITTVNLPFPFKFYGVDYTQASISSNGFIAFGATQDSDWRNWRLPNAGGPSPMIAVFWDDLCMAVGTSNVYTYYDPVMHYYVVEWYHMIAGYNNTSEETFQAILYDPVYYPTQTGDGQIKLQYKVFNNIDTGAGDTYPHGNYATIGIEDHTETIGLEYTFLNTYPTAAGPLSHESALFITTRPLLPNSPYIAVEQTTIFDANSNGHLEPGETAGLAIRLGNHGLVDATGVAATLSSSDPYVTITSNYSVYGAIPAQGNAYPQTNYGISVASNCPGNRIINFNLSVTSTNGNWSYNIPLTVYVPMLGFNTMVITDVVGDHNGVLDPGETAIVNIHLTNSGEVASPAGTATLTCSTPGITIITGSDTFAALAPGASEILTFNLSASASMSDGTLVALIFNAVAGSYSANLTQNVEVGAPLEIVIGNGTSTQAYPLDRYYNYSAHEAIYLASEIISAGSIKAIAFYKGSGSDTMEITPVTIYMKHTSSNSLATGTYSTAGYTQVYNGSFPNNGASGWMELDLNPMFLYDGVSNLSILIVKGYQQWINNYPMWTYSAVTPARARQERNDNNPPTNLAASNNLPNLKLKVFPTGQVLMPPQNLTADASHQSVRLNWEAPSTGSPTSYKIYRNSTLLNTSTGLTYTDLAVTNGTTYSYYLTAVYSGVESVETSTVTATPNAIAPSNLTATGGNTVVNLSWTGASGREELGLSASGDRTISSYRIYRNGSALTTTSETAYQDTGLTNGVSYSYHVTTVYVNPAGESDPSNTATATPNLTSYVVLGTGTSVNSGTQNAPLNIVNNSVHGQSVYTAAELNAAGVTGPAQITSMGFYVVIAPDLPLPNFIVRIKHTTAINAANWHDEAGFTTCYTNASYQPTPGGFEMLAFSAPFTWNGTDNILIDTAFSPVSVGSATGTMQYTSVASGYRFAWSNTADQTNVYTGGTVVSRRYNVRLAVQPVAVGPLVAVVPSTLNFGSVEVNTSSIQQFTVQNTGDQQLTGTITTPTGYTAALHTREANLAAGRRTSIPERNVLSISVDPGQTRTYNLTFTPTAATTYGGDVVITTNASNNPTVNIAVSGTGYIPPNAVLNPADMAAILSIGGNTTDTVTLSNTGGQALTYALVESPPVAWFNAAPTSGSVNPGGNQLITGSFTAAGLTPGTYETNLLINTNDPDTPQLTVQITLQVNNTPPTIELPPTLAFDEGGTLIVDFTPYVADADGQALSLDCQGETNILVNINGMQVTFTATPGWYGSENLTFTVNDGYATTSDEVLVTVNPGNLAVPEISAITANAGGVNIQWSSVPNATSYRVYRSDDPMGTFAFIGSTTQLSYIDNTPSERAFYIVRAARN